MGKIIGYNNYSGLLYINENGLNQFTPSKNVIPVPINQSNYSNKENTQQTLEEMNGNEMPDFYSGNKDKLEVSENQQPPPMSLKEGKKQEFYDNNNARIKKIYD